MPARRSPPKSAKSKATAKPKGSAKAAPLRKSAVRKGARATSKRTDLRQPVAAPAIRAVENERLLIEVLDASPNGAVISRRSDGGVLYVNPAIAAFFGVKPETVARMSTADFFADPQDRARLLDMLRTQRRYDRVELRTRTADGIDKYSLISARPIVFRGEPAILTWVEDETERRERESTLLSSSRQVELVHQIAGIANRAVNFYDALRRGAAEIAEFLQWPIRLVYRLAHGREDLLEIGAFSFAKELADASHLKVALLGGSFGHGDDLPGRVLAEGKPLWVENVARDPSLTRFTGQIAGQIATALAIPVTADSRVVAVLEFLNPRPIAPDEFLLLTLGRLGSELGRVFLRDQTTVALQEARAEAESSARAKASFLAAMSHEVRTPMNGVVGMVDLLLQTHLDEDQRRMLQTVKDSGQALIKVINDILDFSKIDAGRLEIESTEFSILKVVEDVAASLVPTAMQKGLRLLTYVDPRLPEKALGDAVRVRQILSNLGGNAVKFSHAGEIVIRADRLEDGEGGRLRVRFSVKDQGIGIAPEAQRRLFEEFSQADTSTTRRFGGTGLGLAISHRLTTLMGGEIGVASELNRGTEFHCILPFGTASDGAVKPAADLSGVRVLVCAVSEALREAARNYLTFWKAETLTVTQLRDCLPACQGARSHGNPIDVVVIPDLDDVGQLNVLRQAFIDKQLAPYPRIVLGRDPHFSRPLPVDLTDITLVDVNPLRRAGLVTAVAIAAGRASPEPYNVMAAVQLSDVRAPTVAEALAQDRLILVAEDHEANREVLRRQLNRLGYACEIANDGKAALTLFRSKSYAVVLTDCHMPELDGFGLTAAIRESESENGRRTPIIAITANVLQGEAERCLAAGMDDFLPKPAEIGMLKAALERWLGPPPASAEVTAAPVPVPQRRTGRAPVVLDLTIMRETFGAINDEARAMFQLFIDSIRPLIDRFETEIAAADYGAARETIHKARGAAANAGGKELAQVMEKVELALMDQVPDDARRESEGLRPAWERLLEAIAAA